jgi:hypothetical protein
MIHRRTIWRNNHAYTNDSAGSSTGANGYWHHSGITGYE